MRVSATPWNDDMSQMLFRFHSNATMAAVDANLEQIEYLPAQDTIVFRNLLEQHRRIRGNLRPMVNHAVAEGFLVQN